LQRENDAGSGRLVGTRDGKPIRLAPLVLEPLAGGCGNRRRSQEA
jgi:hypothetical protein